MNKLNPTRLAKDVVLVLVAILGFSSASDAQLLPQLVDITNPKITFDSDGVTTYDSDADTLSIVASTIAMQVDPGRPPCFFNPTSGTFRISVQVDAAGALIGGGPGDDLVIMGGALSASSAPDFLCNPAGMVLGGVLMRGTVQEFGYSNFPDTLVFRFSLEEGAFYDLGMREVAVKLNMDGSLTSTFDGTFAAPFSGGAIGDAGVLVALAPPCTGSIGDFVWDDVNQDGIQDAGEVGIPNIPVDLYKWNGTSWDLHATGVNTSASGGYSFSSLCPATYRVQLSTPEGYIPSPTQQGGDPALDSNPNPSDVALTGYGSVDLTNDFGFYAAPPRPFMTVTQGGWGSKPAGNNPGMLLKDNFSLVYPTSVFPLGVVIGDSGSSACPADGGAPYRINLASAGAIQGFLPQGSAPNALNKCETDAGRKITVLAGQVLALTLNVDFSYAGITQPGLGSLMVVSGPLAGRTVNDVLAIGNCMLSGRDSTSCGAEGLTLSGINDVTTRINENFDGGTVNNGYVQ
jgi:hypothetical protein